MDIFAEEKKILSKPEAFFNISLKMVQTNQNCDETLQDCRNTGARQLIIIMWESFIYFHFLIIQSEIDLLQIVGTVHVVNFSDLLYHKFE